MEVVDRLFGDLGNKTWGIKGTEEGGWASSTVGGPFIISPPSSVQLP